MSGDELLTIEVDLKRTTEKAFLVESINTGKQAWVPKQFVEYYEEDGTMTLPRWLAEERELV